MCEYSKQSMFSYNLMLFLSIKVQLEKLSIYSGGIAECEVFYPSVQNSIGHIFNIWSMNHHIDFISILLVTMNFVLLGASTLV